jgi:DNA repair exonuclease SbcCD ATPase subunit
MVMQGNTSRSLSWAGLGVVLGLGLLLVPLFPARGQAPPPAPAPEKKDARDQQIEVLKKAIQILEEQKRQEAPTRVPYRVSNVPDYELVHQAPPGDEKAADLLKQLKQLDDGIAAKRKELEDLEAKARDLRAVLKKLGDRAPVPDGRARDYRTPAGRTEDLEKKLDRLQKELEELRRELKRDRPPVPDRPKDSSSRPPAPAPYSPAR